MENSGPAISAERRRREEEARLAGSFTLGTLAVLSGFLSSGLVFRLSLQGATGYALTGQAGLFVLGLLAVIVAATRRAGRRRSFLRQRFGLSLAFAALASAAAYMIFAVKVYPSVTGVSPSTYAMIADARGVVRVGGTVYVASGGYHYGVLGWVNLADGVWRVDGSVSAPVTRAAVGPDYAAFYQPRPRAGGEAGLHVQLLIYGPGGQRLSAVPLPQCDDWYTPRGFVASELGVVIERDGVAVAWDRRSGVTAAYGPDEWPDEVGEVLLSGARSPSATVDGMTWRTGDPGLSVRDASGDLIAVLYPRPLRFADVFAVRPIPPYIRREVVPPFPTERSAAY